MGILPQQGAFPAASATVGGPFILCSRVEIFCKCWTLYHWLLFYIWITLAEHLHKWKLFFIFCPPSQLCFWFKTITKKHLSKSVTFLWALSGGVKEKLSCKETLHQRDWKESLKGRHFPSAPQKLCKNLFHSKLIILLMDVQSRCAFTFSDRDSSRRGVGGKRYAFIWMMNSFELNLVIGGLPSVRSFLLQSPVLSCTTQNIFASLDFVWQKNYSIYLSILIRRCRSWVC